MMPSDLAFSLVVGAILILLVVLSRQLCRSGKAVTRAQRVRDIPTDPHQNDLCGKMRPGETDCHRLSPS